MTSKRPERGLEEPKTERNQEGNEIALTESLDTNTALIKHMLNTPRLKIDNFDVGEIATTRVSVFYVEGIADPKIVQDVETRIKELKIKYVPHSIVISDELNEPGLAPFQGFKITERFDSVTAALMGGRVLVIVDNTPLGIVVPHLFLENFMAAAEYTTSMQHLTARILRVFTFLLGIYTPSLYLIMAKFHLQDLPEGWRPFFKGEELLDVPIEIIIIYIFVRISSDIVYRINNNMIFILSILFGAILSNLSAEKAIINPYAITIITFGFLAALGLQRRMGSGTAVLTHTFFITSFFLDWKGLAVVSLIAFLRIATGRVYGVPFLSPLIPPRFAEWKDTIFGRGKVKDIINREHKLRK